MIVPLSRIEGIEGTVAQSEIEVGIVVETAVLNAIVVGIAVQSAIEGIEAETVIGIATHVLRGAKVSVMDSAITRLRTRAMQGGIALMHRGRMRPLLPSRRVVRPGRRVALRRLPMSRLLSRTRRRLKCRLPMKAPLTDVRMDKWLWSVRLFKTRGLAIAACDNGRVKLAGQTVKPSRSLRVGDVITVAATELTKTVKVLQLIDKRVGAREVPEVMEDLTPQEDYARARERRELDGFTPRPQGTGRPSKKDRRALEEFEQS